MGIETFEQMPSVFIVSGNRIAKDITKQHLFTGYNPLIFAFPFSCGNKIKIILSQRLLKENEAFNAKDAIAVLNFKKIREDMLAGSSVCFFEGVRGRHRFLSPFHQFIIGINNTLFNKKTGNVFLRGNLYCQVQVAYAVPRKISLITLGKNNLYNLFPTDLHGPVNDGHYIISLRSKGMACMQVETIRQLVISEPECNAYKTVYALGKNHMQELKPGDNFDFGPSNSQILQIPLPRHIITYRELELINSFIHGIHTVFLFRILFHYKTGSTSAVLAHVHNGYATWRQRKGLPGNYLMR